MGRAHPRSRGENSHARPRPDWRRGSSPLTRGKLNQLFEFCEVRGLIPAHAGKTPRGSPASRTPWAHPRSRGENSYLYLTRTPLPGSSPLTRGKPIARQNGKNALGLIPAHAGKTPCSRMARTRGTAHPRSRGENTRYWWVTSRRGGSSPLTRGKPTESPERRADVRLIPAHAGKTARRWPRSAQRWAHPRSRGENAA